MSMMETRKRPRRAQKPGYAVFRRRRRVGLILVLLAVLFLGILGAYLFSGPAAEETGVGSSEGDEAQIAEEAGGEDAASDAPPEEQAEETEAAPSPPPAPQDPTLFLTVPRLGVFGHTVRNDDSAAALDLGAVKLPGTGFPWEKGSNTYIACHRVGFPNTESFNQCLNLPSMQKGDEVYLEDTNGTVYPYRVSEVFAVSPSDFRVTAPIPGKDVVSLQTCTETPYDWQTLGPGLFGGGPESGRLVVQAERVT